MNILTQLEKQGLSKKQAQVYLAILELGRATAIDIARKTRIKRTTCYDLIEDLQNKKYIAETKKGKQRLFIARDPEILIGLSEQRFADIKNLVPFLSEIHAKAVPKPNIIFYDGIEGVQAIMEEILTMKEKEQLYWGSVDDLVEILGGQYVKNWLRRRIRKEIWSRALFSKKTRLPEFYTQSDETYLRKSKRLPSNIIFDGILCAFDDKIAYISSRKESFGFIIRSKDFSNMFKQIFESMWLIAD